MNPRTTLILLFLANSISGFAQGITMLSVPWYFVHSLGLENEFGNYYGAITLGAMLWILYAGTLVDRYSRKKVFLSINLAGAVVLGAASALGYAIGGIPGWLALTCFAATLFIYNLHFPTLYAFCQEITLGRDYSRINSYIEIQGQMTSMLAGGAAALLLSGYPQATAEATWLHLPFSFNPWPMEKIFLLNATTYCIAFVIIGFMRYTPVHRELIETGSVLHRLRQGLGYLGRRPILFLFGLGSLSIFVVTIVHEMYLLSRYVQHRLHAQATVYASSQLFYALGAVTAGILIRKVFRKMHHPFAIAMLIGAGTLFVFAIGMSATVGMLFAFSFILGLTNAGSRIMRITYIFHQVPNYTIGRVNSVFSVLHTFQRSLFIFLFAIPLFSGSAAIGMAYQIFGIYTLAACFLLIYAGYKLPRTT